MRNPHIARLADLRRRILAADAADELDENLVKTIGKLAADAVAAHSPALLTSALAFAARLAAIHGHDPAPLLARLTAKWGELPTGVHCTACGRAFRPPENATTWRMFEVEYRDDAREVVAMCGPPCVAEIESARWPGYVSFSSDELARDFARRVGLTNQPAFAFSRLKDREERRPS